MPNADPILINPRLFSRGVSGGVPEFCGESLLEGNPITQLGLIKSGVNIPAAGNSEPPAGGPPPSRPPGHSPPPGAVWPPQGPPPTPPTRGTLHKSLSGRFEVRGGGRAKAQKAQEAQRLGFALGLVGPPGCWLHCLVSSSPFPKVALQG